MFVDTAADFEIALVPTIVMGVSSNSENNDRASLQIREELCTILVETRIYQTQHIPMAGILMSVWKQKAQIEVLKGQCHEIFHLVFFIKQLHQGP